MLILRSTAKNIVSFTLVNSTQFFLFASTNQIFLSLIYILLLIYCIYSSFDCKSILYFSLVIFVIPPLSRFKGGKKNINFYLISPFCSLSLSKATYPLYTLRKQLQRILHIYTKHLVLLLRLVVSNVFFFLLILRR